MKKVVLLLAIFLARATSAFAANHDDLDARLAQIFKEKQIPGASVALVENGEVTFAKGYGYADVAKKIPATADRAHDRLARDLDEGPRERRQGLADAAGSPVHER